MPKQVFDGKKVVIKLDETPPQDKAEMVRRDYIGKAKVLTPADKVKLFDAYLEAGLIKL